VKLSSASALNWITVALTTSALELIAVVLERMCIDMQMEFRQNYKTMINKQKKKKKNLFLFN
jgi:hypothetical protein